MATLVVRPDAHPETSTFDGVAAFSEFSDQIWDDVRGAAAATSIDDADTSLVMSLAGGLDPDTFLRLGRGVLGFDTSALTAGATISAATLQLRTNDTPSDGLTQGFNLSTITAPTSPTEITDTDYAVAKYDSTKLCDADRAITGMAVNTDYIFTLNASGIAAINKTGITWLALRFVTDITDAEPAHAGGLLESYVSFHSAEAATEAHRPTLTITYTAAAEEEVGHGNGNSNGNGN